MFIRVLGCAVLLLIVSGCAIAEDDPITAQQHKELDACDRKLEAKQFRKRVDYARCMNQANGKSWVRSRDVDLFENAAAREIAAAERLDRGKMTEAEYRAEKQRIKSDLLSEVAQREAYRMQAQPPPRPVYQSPPPTGPTFCTVTGKLVTCF